MVAEACKSGTPEMDLCKFKVSMGYTGRPSLKAKQKCRRRRKRGKKEEKEKAQKPAAPRPELYTITSILASEVTEEPLGLSLLL